MRRSMQSLGAAIALVAAACGGSSGESPSTPPTPSTTTALPGTTSTLHDATSTSDQPTTTMPSIERPDLTFAVADGWSAVAVGVGVKPAVALDSSGSPAMAWLFERVGEGFVAYAAADDGWAGEAVREGYFYGPIDLAFDRQDVPFVAYHDHQADDFDPELGDLTIVYPDGDRWTRDVARHPGHDGWDTALVIGGDGVFHAAGVDPSQFGSEVGIEYYRKSQNGWEVTPIGSGPTPYQYNLGLALDNAGLPAMSFYDFDNGDLRYAHLADGLWDIETVASDGDIGKYSSLAFTAEGDPAITSFEQTGSEAGRIVYAVRRAGTWTMETVGDLASFEEGNARRNSSLAFDSAGRPHVAFSDTSGVWYAVRQEPGWVVERIVTADLPLGQLVSLRLDAADVAHLGIYEVTNPSPLDGSVAYLTNG